AVLAQARRGLAGLRQGGAMDGCGPGAAGDALQLEAVEAPSGVSAQPRGRQETRLGALNRLKAARSTAAGAAADFCIAFEGGVEADDTGRLVCFAVVCAQYRSPRSKRILRGPRDSMSRLVEHGVPGSLFQNQLLVPSVF
ncbi:unnamed protein product, partial [Prorocentrum cordatum]